MTAISISVSVHALARFRERCDPSATAKGIAALIGRALALGAEVRSGPGGRSVRCNGVKFVLGPCGGGAAYIVVTCIVGPKGYRP